MGDLQSPTYVKRTAHMFNSIYSAQNGSSHSPSYLKVSKSLSGYSCLSYNNNANAATTITTHTTTHQNGSSTTNGGSSKVITHRFSSGSSPFSERFVSTNLNGSSPSPVSAVEPEPRIPASPKRSSFSPERNGTSSQKNQNQEERSSDYVPSHGKSFIMQKIERLYGPQAHAVTIMSKKSVASLSPVPVPVPEVTKSIGDMPMSEPDLNININTNTNVSTVVNAVKKSEKDGNYFLEEMRNTAKELERLSEKAGKELEIIDEQSERAGNIAAAIGKANLLVKKKFKQFEELCRANLRGVVEDEPITTSEDLAGFWDMVMIQVDQVYSLFKDLDDNNSKIHEPSEPVRTKPSSPRKTSATPASKSKDAGQTAAAKAREETRRKFLLEKRRQKQAQQEQETKEKDQSEVHCFVEKY